MLFIERVIGNVKGGADVKIGRCTLISGPNGSGKSTVVNIIELALMGYASDIVGRPEVRKGVDLITLAPEGEPLKAEVYTTENDRAHFTIERNGPGKTKEAEHVGLADIAVVWPIREAVTALRGSTATARSFVLRHGGLSVAEDSILARFGDEQTRTLYQTLAAGVVAQAKTDLDTVDVLLGVQDAAKVAERTIKAKAKGAKEIIDQTSATLTVDFAPEAEKEAEDKINALNEKLANLRVARKPPPAKPAGLSKATFEAKINALVETINKGEQHLADVAGQYQKLSEDLANPGLTTPPARTIDPAQVEGVIAADGTYAFHQQHAELAHCIVCWQPWQPGSDVLAARRQTISGLLTAYREQEQKISDQASWVQTANTRMQELMRQGNTLHQMNVANRAAAEAFAAQYQAAGEEEQEQLVDFSEIDRQINEVMTQLADARKGLTEIQQTRASWALVRKAQKQIIEAKRESEAAKNLAEEAGSVADALLSQGRAGFVSRVQAFLPPDDEFDVVLKDGKRSVCMFGFRRNGVLHTALSGAEWARLTIALGAAIIPTEGRVLAILTPEERAFDADTLGEVMEALKAAPGQVILTSPVEPPSPIEGWTMLRRG